MEKNIFKLASRSKLRFNTSKGNISTEQLWDLSLEELDDMAVVFQSSLDKKKSFLTKNNPEEQEIRLKFDVVFDVLVTKQEENEAKKVARINKEHNEKISAIIAQKVDKKLAEKSVDELSAMLK